MLSIARRGSEGLTGLSASSSLHSKPIVEAGSRPGVASNAHGSVGSSTFVLRVMTGQASSPFG